MGHARQLLEQKLELHLFMDDPLDGLSFLFAEHFVLLLDDELGWVQTVVGHFLSFVLL